MVPGVYVGTVYAKNEIGTSLLGVSFSSAPLDITAKPPSGLQITNPQNIYFASSAPQSIKIQWSLETWGNNSIARTTNPFNLTIGSDVSKAAVFYAFTLDNSTFEHNYVFGYDETFKLMFFH